MERAGVLINKLQEQLAQNEDIYNMLVTVQLLQGELLEQLKLTNLASPQKVAVIMPFNMPGVQLQPAPVGSVAPTPEAPSAPYKPVPAPDPEPAPVEEPAATPESTPVVPEPQPMPKPAPEPIPHFAEERPWQRLFASKDEPGSNWALDPMMEIPTLAHQEKEEKVVFELNEVMVAEAADSIHDKLKHDSDELVNKLQETPVKDLKKAISINDRHRFISELFRSDEAMYERSIKTINGFHIFAEAEFWIQRELKVKLGWDNAQELVKVFDQIVKRRFS